MDDAGSLSDIELDDASLTPLMGMGGEQQQTRDDSSDNRLEKQLNINATS